MAYPIPFNKFGLFGLETVNAKIVSNTLTYEFEAHPYVNAPYNGLLLIHLTSPSPSETTEDMPIYFETKGLSNARKPVTKEGGVPLTAADITIPCYKLFFYDFRTGVVESVN